MEKIANQYKIKQSFCGDTIFYLTVVPHHHNLHLL